MDEGVKGIPGRGTSICKDQVAWTDPRVSVESAGDEALRQKLSQGSRLWGPGRDAEPVLDTWNLSSLWLASQEAGKS